MNSIYIYIHIITNHVLYVMTNHRHKAKTEKIIIITIIVYNYLVELTIRYINMTNWQK